MKEKMMTHKEANAEALKRWGKYGVAEERRAKRWHEDQRSLFVVGTIGAMPENVAYGKGYSWEEAFNDAEERAKEEEAARAIMPPEIRKKYLELLRLHRSNSPNQ